MLLILLMKALVFSFCGLSNICSGVPTTVRQLAERIADETGRRDLLRFGSRAENQFDPPMVVGVRED